MENDVASATTFRTDDEIDCLYYLGEGDARVVIGGVECNAVVDESSDFLQVIEYPKL